MGIGPHSALVSIRIEQADLSSLAARWDLERPRRQEQQQQQRIDEPLDRGAQLAVAGLSAIAASDGRLVDPLARTNHELVCTARSGAVMSRRQSSGHRSDR